MINFNGARLLTYEHIYEYLGDNLNYAVQKHLVIDGSLYDLTNQSGVISIWQQLLDMVDSATDYDPVIINGVNFGNGRINRFNFEEGTDVRQKKYTVDITILSSGDLSNMVGSDFTGITLPNIEFTENFSESFDFTIAEDGRYTYRQSVNVKYTKCDAIPDPIQAAKDLATELLHSSPAYGFIDAQHAGFYTHAGKRTYTERYNTLTNECSFTENFTLANTRSPSDGYSIESTQQLQTGEDGISTLSETGHVVGIDGTIGAAQTGLGTELSTVFARLSTLLNTYITSPRALNATYTVLQVKSNQFTATIDYTIQYNNDPRNQSTYSWDYTQSFERGASCYYVVKESGRIKGITTDCSRANQYANALAAWTATIKPGIQGRAQSFYEDQTGLTNTLQSLSVEERKSVHAGEIGYNNEYTDDPTFNNNQIIKRMEVEVTDDLPTLAVNRFAVAHVGEIEQDLGFVKQAKRTVSLKMLGKRSALLPDYTNKAKTTLNTLIPTGSNVFIDGCNYSWTPTENTFELQLSWTYFNPVEPL